LTNEGAKTGRNSHRWREFRAGVVACVPTLLGYWAIGFACGAIGRVNGFTLWEIMALAIFVYAGSAHFLFYQLALIGSSVMAIALAVAFINMRYLLINAYMAQFFARFSFRQKIISGLLMTDETFGVAANQARRSGGGGLSFNWLLGLNLLAWWNWIFANFVGAVLASALPDWLREALSFSLVGMFLGLLILTFYASQTKLIESFTILIAIAVMLMSQHLMEANSASIIATLIAAGGGVLLLRAIKGQRLRRHKKNRAIRGRAVE